MGFDAKILADSVSPDSVRLTTFEITFPRPFLAEMNTHRVFSRNSASSRAIPVEKMIKRVMEDPYIPSSWGKNQKGMQAGEDVDTQTQLVARQAWLFARDQAVERAQTLLDFGIHKQLTNRLLEPFMWHTVIVTATEWSNFFHLRNNPLAQPEIQIIARMMQQLYESCEPEKLWYGKWHLPLVTDRTELAHDKETTGSTTESYWAALCKVSVGRCARVSYLTHDGKRDPAADIALHDSLLAAGHMSPFEHVARPMTQQDAPLKRHFAQTYCGNLRGWFQYRKTIPGEADILGVRT